MISNVAKFNTMRCRVRSFFLTPKERNFILQLCNVIIGTCTDKSIVILLFGAIAHSGDNFIILHYDNDDGEF